MAKKKTAPTRPRPSRAAFDPLDWRWLGMGGLGVFALGLIWLFRGFFFSSDMIVGSDLMSAGFFFRSFVAEVVHNPFSFPQWNPYIFGGMPYLEAFFGDVLYPPSLLIRHLGDIWTMLSLNLVIHIWLAGVGTYLFTRQIGLGRLPALTAAAAYLFAPYLVSFVAPWHDGKIFVTALLPFGLLLLDRGFSRRPLLNFTLFGGIIGLIILTPHPQMAYFSLWLYGLYTLHKLWHLWREKATPLRMLLPTGLAAYAVALGLAISAIQFLPGFIYTREFSPRADTKSGWEWATSWSMHAEEAFSLVIPEFSGVSTQGAETFYWGKNPFKDNSESTGALVFFLALFGAVASRRRGRWFFIGVGLFSLTYALGATTPLFRLYFLIPLVESLRAPSMIMFLLSLSAAVLAGMGVQRVMSGSDKDDAMSRAERGILLGWPALLGLLAVGFTVAGESLLGTWSAIFYPASSTEMVQQGVSKADLALMNLPAIRSGAWFAFFFVSIASGILWSIRMRKATPVLLVVIPLLVMVDGIRFGGRFVETAPAEEFIRPDPVTTYLASLPGEFRVLDLSDRRGPNSSRLPYHGIEVVAGYHGNQLRWYDDLLGSLTMANLLNARFLQLANARYVILPAGQQLPEGFLGPQAPVLARNFGPVAVYENPNALPRVYLADSVVRVEDRRAAYDAVINGSADLSEVVYLEEESPVSVTWSPDTLQDEQVAIGYAHYGSMGLTVSSPSPQLLVITQNWYDAWAATVNGESVDVLRAYGSFKAIPVPAGESEVILEYHSPRFRTGAWVTAGSLIWMLGVVGVSLLLGRRRRDESEA